MFATAPLGEIAPARPSSLDRDPKELIWQVNLDHIEADTGRLLKREMKPFAKAGSSTHAFDDRHVLYSKLRPYLNKVLVPDEEGIATTELVPMLPDPERLDRGYLAHYLMTKRFVSWITEHSSGAKMPRATMADFWAHEIPVPPLPEQKRIAVILDKADAIRRKRQQAIELADQFLRSVFLDLFGDPLHWNVKIPKAGWSVKPVEEIAHLKRGYDLPVHQRVDGEVPVFASNGIVGYHNSAKVAGPGVVTGRSGTLGSVRYSENGFWPLNTTLYVTDFHGNEPRYIEWFLRMYKLDRFHRGAGVPTLNRNLFLKDLTLLPPVGLQKQFVSILRKTRSLRTRLEEAPSEALFQSLSQKAFAGEL